MPHPRPQEDDLTRCVDELRAALAVHGITLPSLRADPLTYHGAYAGLVALGSCNSDTARALTAALRKAAPA
ncbi:hypothetical protein AB0E75_02780 [Streptomyces griseoviridis]|jgi:hypothetical protein|uniref:Uncharacterized protein n=3 Tax=Streptomyces TaxID=1883 RepID=A0A918G949_STRGD|nr:MULTISPECIES: hypothetical protein [Streptomyces]MDP9683767.1 hypothetical protein [Streptomyces griseoviridis]GGS25341.1 hypothetical protein GCM10010238_12010 [Streptomyces niveoruber]GGS92394.1 hypothetical protein GCM10010240_27200 [Streptomyces griseoviridis]GGU22720.1 hypothetical protein GCM10010259_11590 [Streptomyces daghestanicus]GHI31284.1 hypothetical protein Sdagh_30140 [Streptomyces daghestanicus]